jgi:hypothetical protein
MLGRIKDLEKGHRFRIVSEFDTPREMLGAGHWHIAWDLSPGSKSTRVLSGASKKTAEWVRVDKNEPLRIQRRVAGGWA